MAPFLLQMLMIAILKYSPFEREHKSTHTADMTIFYAGPGSIALTVYCTDLGVTVTAYCTCIKLKGQYTSMRLFP